KRRGAAGRNLPKVEDQEAVEKLAHGTSLGRAGVQLGELRPIGLRERRDEFSCFGREFAPSQVWCQTECAEQLQFESKDRSRLGRLLRQGIEETGEQRVDFRQWRVGFRRLLDERGGVSDLTKITQLVSQSRVSLAQPDFAERVQL